MNPGRQREIKTIKAKSAKSAREGGQKLEFQGYFPMVQGSGLESGSEGVKAEALYQLSGSPAQLMQVAQTRIEVRTSTEALQNTPQSPQLLAMVAGTLPPSLQWADVELGG